MIQYMQSKMITIEFSPKIDRLFFWFAFLMAFPAFVIIQNVSIYLFLIIIAYLIKSGYSNIGFSKKIQRFALLFAFGAIVSSIGSYIINGNEYFMRSLQVLPNYIYWSFLIIILVQHRNRLKFKMLFKAITLGVILFIPYFFFLQYTPLIHAIPIFRTFPQNSFSFLLICFAPIAIFYLKNKYGKIPAITFIIIFSLSGLISGSRSGSVLVFTGSFLAFFLTGRIDFWRSLLTAIAIFFVVVVLSTNFGENLLKSLNPRTHELIYSTQSTFETDRSYLIRRALVDKGLDLFSRYPVAGVGLNNFGATTAKITGDFEGAELVINKGVEQGKSAHNSYLSLLAEGGILLSAPFVLILLSLILYFIRNIRNMSDYYRPVFIGLLMMAVHLYFISALLNVYAWFLIGMAAALVYRENESDRQKSLHIHRDSPYIALIKSKL